MYFDQTQDLDLEGEDIDSYFVNSQRVSQQQLLLLEEENTR